jgi:serine/threonine-protein kinase
MAQQKESLFLTRRDGLDATLAAAPSAAPAVRTAVDGVVRTTVLPKDTGTADPAVQVGNERRFEVVQVLGAGGMGEVALAEDRDIRRKVAVKKLHPEARSGAGLARFAEEVRIIGQLEHPNITPVHDVGIDESGQHYFVMKYIDGETLESIIAKLRAGEPGYAQRYGNEERIEIFIGILNAVRYAHARGIVHRDLKPANIMVGQYGEVTVVDWGIAKKRGGAESTPGLVGTPLYMSPEQAAGDQNLVDERSDIYSLCLVLLELLTLSHPLAGKNGVEAVLSTLLTDGIEAGIGKIKLCLTRSGAPTDYAELISRGLQRDPAHRWASVADLEQGLKNVREGKVPVSCHITFTKRALGELTLYIDRHPWVFTVYLSLFLTAFIATVLFAGAHLLR